MMLKQLLPVILLVCSITLRAQTKADSTRKLPSLKTLSAAEYHALQNGDDLNGMARAAELNYFPLPASILKYKKQLLLDATQVSRLTAIDAELLRKKKEMGVFILRNEKMIDSIFKTNKVTDGNLIFYTNRYGIYQGELRNAILQACLQAKKLLTPKQITQFSQLHVYK